MPWQRGGIRNLFSAASSLNEVLVCHLRHLREVKECPAAVIYSVPDGSSGERFNKKDTGLRQGMIKVLSRRPVRFEKLAALEIPALIEFRSQLVGLNSVIDSHVRGIQTLHPGLHQTQANFRVLSNNPIGGETADSLERALFNSHVRPVKKKRSVPLLHTVESSRLLAVVEDRQRPPEKHPSPVAFIADLIRRS